MSSTPKKEITPPEAPAPVTPIVKPSNDPLLEKLKSKRPPTIAGVDTNSESYPLLRMVEANDYLRLHPDEEYYWSPELCFVKVPIKGQSKDLLHCIDEDIAVANVSSGKILRFRLALATKPHDVFFLCQLPTQNLDNSWNESVLKAAEQAKRQWIEVTSRKAEGKDYYKVDTARDADAFPEPNWPSQSLGVIIINAFTGRYIDRDDHPALLRLVGAKQRLS
jgi:hypothetical protein